MKLNRSKKGFTLVEIMIVVVIIGLLAAMAIPAFQKVRRSSVGKAMVNDARQIGAAFQQIALNNPSIAVLGATYSVTVDAQGVLGGTPTAGLGAGDLIQNYVRKVSRGTGNFTYAFGVVAGAEAFTLTHGQCSPSDVISGSTVNNSTVIGTAVSFDEEGKAR
jgi:prepilin-type N-terminal cleavage/methylation domain-containing protein